MNKVYKYFEPNLKYQFTLDSFFGVGILGLFENRISSLSNDRIEILSMLNNKLFSSIVKRDIDNCFYGLIGALVRGQEAGVNVIIQVLKKILVYPNQAYEKRLPLLNWVIIRVRSGVIKELKSLKSERQLIYCNGNLQKLFVESDYMMFVKVFYFGFSIEEITKESGLHALEVIYSLKRSLILVVKHFGNSDENTNCFING